MSENVNDTTGFEEEQSLGAPATVSLLPGEEVPPRTPITKEPYMANHYDRYIDHDTNAYNLTLIDIQDIVYRRSATTGERTVTFGRETDSTFLEGFGFSKVWPTTYPGGLFYEVTPVLNSEDGRYYQTWVERILTEEEKMANYESERYMRVEQYKQILQNTREVGVSVNFGGNVGVLHMQLNNSARLNFGDVTLEAADLVAENKGDEVMIIRTTENVNVEVLASDVVGLMRKYRKSTTELLAQSWNWTDAMRIKVYPEELLEVPVEIVLTEIDLTAV